MAFTHWYYRHSPLLARFIAATPLRRMAAYAALAPVAAAAWILLHPTGGLLLGGLVLLLARRWARRPAATAALPLGLLAFCLMAAPNAFAFEESPKDLWLNFKAGAYQPKEIPYFKAIYGSDKGVLIGLDGGWELYDGIGTLSLGGGIGYYREKGKALQESSLPLAVPSGSEVTFQEAPGQVYAQIDLRFWENQPLVPYGRYGYEAVYFREEAETTFSGFADGPFWGGGGRLLLDLLDPASARLFDADYGINNTYLCVEYLRSRSQKDDFFDFASESVYGGLTLEF
jgi:hypothetical protein